MFVQHRLGDELPVAAVTLVRPLPSMAARVKLQTIRPRESLLTEGALEGPLAGVLAPVVAQRTKRRERLIALAALDAA